MRKIAIIFRKFQRRDRFQTRPYVINSWSLMPDLTYGISNTPPYPSQEGNLRSPLLGGNPPLSPLQGGDLGVGKKVVGFCLLKPNLIYYGELIKT